MFQCSKMDPFSQVPDFLFAKLLIAGYAGYAGSAGLPISPRTHGWVGLLRNKHRSGASFDPTNRGASEPPRTTPSEAGASSLGTTLVNSSLAKPVVKPKGTYGDWGSSMTSESPNLGVSENSVPHCTQWLMIIIPIKWLFHWEYTLFSDKPI